MNYVYGPYLEYDCSVCGKVVKENAPKNKDRLDNRIAQLNTESSTRCCAGCYKWGNEE